LMSRLQGEGWIQFHSPVLASGMNGSCIIRAGSQLKRLLIMLQKSTRSKRPTKQDVHSRFHFSATYVEKRISSIRQKENEPPPEHILDRIPILRRWMGRGNN